MNVTIREYRDGDAAGWLRMRVALWPDLADEADGGLPDTMEWLARPDATVLFAELPGSASLAGFVEVGERPYADGCSTAPVAYFEGWFVDPELRGRGIGRALFTAAEDWARARGYSEFASDALLENLPSQAAHQALGFVEVERAVRYRKAL